MSQLGRDAGAIDIRKHAEKYYRYPRGHLGGCVLSRPNADDITVTAGSARDSGDAYNIDIVSALTKQIDAPWATGTNAGGLGTADLADGITVTFSLTASPDTITADSGTPFGSVAAGDRVIVTGDSFNDGVYDVASSTSSVITLGDGVLSQDSAGSSATIHLIQSDQWYHCFAIATHSGVSDIGFDTSVTAANLLTSSGYDVYRRIGSFLTESAADILDFIQAGDWFFWETNQPALDISASTLGTTPVTGTASAPTGVRTMALINCAYDAGTIAAITVSPTDMTIGTPSTSSVPIGHIAHLTGTASDYNSQVLVLLDTSAQYNVESSASLGSGSFTSATVGWMDWRGKDD